MLKQIDHLSINQNYWRPRLAKRLAAFNRRAARLFKAALRKDPYSAINGCPLKPIYPPHHGSLPL